MTGPRLVAGIKLAVLAGLLLGAFAVLRSSRLRHELEPKAAVLWLRAQEPYSGLAYIAACIVGILVLAPDTALNFVGAIVFGPIVGTMLAWVGVMVGSLLAFGLAKFLGRDSLRRMLGDRLDEWEGPIRKGGFRGLLIVRLLPFASFSLVSYLAGLTGIGLFDYVLATAVATLVMTFLFQYGFWLLGEETFAPGVVHEHLHLMNILLLLALAGVHVVALVLASKRLRPARAPAMMGLFVATWWGMAALAGPLAPSESQRQFSLVEGFGMALVASEPDITDPVAIAWDERGGMFIVEMNDYPVSPRKGRVKFATDSDGDGRPDQFTIFAEGLPFPTSVLPHRGGLLVACAPDIIYLRDKDGDGKADEREVVLTGFAEGNQQLRVNGLFWGTDGWVYGANGRSGGRIHSPKHPELPPLSIDRYDFRFLPDAGLVQPLAGYSQFGHAMDDFGRRFLNWNTMPVRFEQLPECYASRQTKVPLPPGVVELVDPVAASRVFPKSAPSKTFNREPSGFFNASCGLSIDRGDLFQDGRTHVFVCEPLFNLVHHRVIAPAGSLFSASRPPGEKDREFLASSDSWCHPVFIATGPDGSLYVVDFYRQFVEHPQFVPENLRQGVDFEHGRGHGHIWRIWPHQRPPSALAPLAVRTSAELVGELASLNGWRRLTAQRLLVERGDKSIANAVEQLARSSDQPAVRAIARWTLQRLGVLPDEVVDLALRDPSADAREDALRLAEPRLDRIPGLYQLARAACTDPDARVRCQAVLSVSQVRRPATLTALASTATRQPLDERMRGAILCSIGQEPGSFFQAWTLAERGMETGKLSPEAVELLHAVAMLAGNTDDASQRQPLLEWIRQIESLSRNEPKTLRLVAALGLAEGITHSGHRPIPAEPRTFTTAMNFARQLLSVEPGESADWAALATAARLLGFDQRPGSQEVLARLLRPEVPRETQLAAIASIGKGQPGPIAERFLAIWTSASRDLRRAMLEIMVRRADLWPTLLSAVERGEILPAEIDLEARQRLVAAPDAALRQRAQKLFAPPASDRAQVVERYRRELPASGDAELGAKLFEKHCATCHLFRRLGNRVGPELSGLITRPRAQLVEDVLDPNRQTVPDYLAYLVATKDGQVRQGLVAAETSAAITLRRADNTIESIPRAQVEVFRSTGKSYMPEGLEQTLSVKDLADLIEYLHQPG